MFGGLLSVSFISSLMLELDVKVHATFTSVHLLASRVRAVILTTDLGSISALMLFP